jgi:predicted dinucleotide-utilizing enzyme
MSDPSPFGEPRRGLVARLFARQSRKTVKRVERLDLVVPSGQADAVHDAVMRWLAGHGVTATISTEAVAEGKTRLHASLGEEDTRKLDLTSTAVQTELEGVISSAVTRPPQ